MRGNGPHSINASPAALLLLTLQESEGAPIYRHHEDSAARYREYWKPKGSQGFSGIFDQASKGGYKTLKLMLRAV